MDGAVLEIFFGDSMTIYDSMRFFFAEPVLAVAVAPSVCEPFRLY